MSKSRRKRRRGRCEALGSPAKNDNAEGCTGVGTAKNAGGWDGGGSTGEAWALGNEEFEMQAMRTWEAGVEEAVKAGKKREVVVGRALWERGTELTNDVEAGQEATTCSWWQGGSGSIK